MKKHSNKICAAVLMRYCLNDQGNRMLVKEVYDQTQQWKLLSSAKRYSLRKLHEDP